MKTICFFNSTISWGGGEKWHLETSSYLHGKGYKVLVIANKKGILLKKLKENDIPHLGIQVTNLSFLNILKIIKVKDILVTYQVQTIIINLSRDLKLAGISSKKAGVKKIIYRRGSAIPIKNSFLNRYYFKNIVTDILANSIATKKTVTQNNKSLFPTDKIKVIYNGIRVNDFTAKKCNPVYIKKEGEIVITSLGRLEFEKNHEFLIKLAQELKKRKVLFKIIIGGEGSLKSTLIAMSKELGVEKEVSFAGFIANPGDLIHSGDIFILPSIWEGFGYVMAEAALCKIPIIAFNTTSVPEIVQHKKTGFIAEPNDVEYVANKVTFLMKNPELKTMMGEEGYKFAFKNFNSETILSQIEEYIIHG